MRHMRIDRGNAAEAASVAAVWPQLEDAVQAKAASEETVAQPFAATPAAPDVSVAVGRLIVGSYLAVLGVFFGLFARSPLALFSVVVCAVFVAVFFTVPRIFLAVAATPGPRPKLADFMSRGIETLTGPTRGSDALLQMIIVPVLLTLGLAAIGIIGLIFIR